MHADMHVHGAYTYLHKVHAHIHMCVHNVTQVYACSQTHMHLGTGMHTQQMHVFSHTYAHTPRTDRVSEGLGTRENGDLCLVLLFAQPGCPSSHRASLMWTSSPCFRYSDPGHPQHRLSSRNTPPPGGQTGGGVHSSGHGLGHASRETWVLEQRPWPTSRGRLGARGEWPSAPQTACRQGGPLNTGPGPGVLVLGLRLS